MLAVRIRVLEEDLRAVQGEEQLLYLLFLHQDLLFTELKDGCLREEEQTPTGGIR